MRVTDNAIRKMATKRILKADVFGDFINACSQAAIRANQGSVGVCLVYITNAGAPLMSGSHQLSLCNAQPVIP